MSGQQTGADVAGLQLSNASDVCGSEPPNSHHSQLSWPHNRDSLESLRPSVVHQSPCSLARGQQGDVRNIAMYQFVPVPDGKT